MPKLNAVTILHFNDVYNIEAREKEPVGGASRFTSLLREVGGDDALVLFSGDAFNPSMMSTVMKGKQMVPCLNEMRINTAVYGNHDFDFGVDALIYLAGSCNFRWLMSNVFDKVTNKPLANGEVSRLIEWGVHKIGLVGLVEMEWLATLGTISVEDVIFKDFVPEGGPK